MTHISYDNCILNDRQLLDITKERFGMKTLDDLITLGDGPEVANEIVSSVNCYGIKHVLDILFGNCDKYELTEEIQFG